MDQNLRIPILPPIKLRVRLRRFLDPNLVADDEGRLCAPRDDHVSQVAVVGLDVALAGS
jgi:hypothetical protein